MSDTAFYSLDEDPQGIRFRTAEACSLALAMGVQGNPPPPVEHWLMPFWQMGNEHARVVLATFDTRAVDAERERCCRIVFGQCDSDNVAQRTVDDIRKGAKA